MIERLRKLDIERAITVFQKGLSLEIPPGNMGRKIIGNELRKTICYVHKTNGRLDGLVNFKLNKGGSITLMFICTLKPRNGVGTELMLEVAKFALGKKVKWVYSLVSFRDKRATSFYYRLNFKSYAKKKKFGYYMRAKPISILKSGHQTFTANLSPGESIS